MDGQKVQLTSCLKILLPGPSSCLSRSITHPHHNMSFQEVRLFTETMRSLGYPRLISLDNFRAPNFELVADCLHWLIQRFYPECRISDAISTESERIAFLQAIAQVTLSKARMRLNLRKLYAADGAAVRELLKLAELLHRATQTAASTADEDASDVSGDPTAALKLLDISAAKAAAAEITRVGVALHDGLLAEQTQLQEARHRALAAAHDTGMVEAGIQATIAGLAEGVSSLSSQLAELTAAEATLSGRLEKRRSELERAEKRLATLAGVRPAYMDEYEALQGQLQVLWLHYLERFRNLQYLEAALAGYHKTQQDAADAAERRRRKMQRRLAEEELRILRGEAAVDNSRRTASARTGTGHDGSSSSGGDSDGSSDSDNSDGDDRAGRQDVGGGRARGGIPVRGLGGFADGRVSRGAPATAAGEGAGRRTGSAKGQQQQQQQGGQVVGSLAAGAWDDDDDDSIDDDTATDGGELSRAGSDAGGGGGGSNDVRQHYQQQRHSGGDGLDAEGNSGGQLESEDSGF